MKFLGNCLVVAAALAALAYQAPAQIPRTMSYQGILTDNGGVPVRDSTYQLYIGFYATETGGSAVASRGPIPATTTRGLFNIIIGNGGTGNVPLNDFNTNQQFWLSVRVGSPGATELLPRPKLTGTFYAFRADTANVALNASGGLILPFNGSVASSTQAFKITNTGTDSTSYGVVGQTASGNALVGGVYGIATTGAANGVMGESRSSSDGAAGVSGFATATTGQTFGTAGDTYSSTDVSSGVLGRAWAQSGRVYGVLGITYSTSQFATGVRGSAPAASGETRGVWGSTGSASQFATGVSGYASATTGDTRGVVGETVSNSPNAFGTMGIATAPAVALFALGNSFATGTKSAVVPLDVTNPKDPEGTRNASEWRAMYTVEAAEVWFEDMGFATLQNGKAVVNIDEIFGKTANLNRPYHVFITPYGNCGSLSVTARTAGSFTVEDQGGKSSVEFSYRIVAKRLGYEDTRMERRPDPLTGYRPSDPQARKQREALPHAKTK